MKLPAGIDIHVHFREPGYTYKESMETGICAANAGGIAHVFDMPNTDPVIDSVEELMNKTRLSSKYYGIHCIAGITDRNVKNGEIKRLKEHINIFKIFLADSTGNLGISQSHLFTALDELDRDQLIMVHAEDASLLKKRGTGILENQARPPEAESNSIEFVLELAQEFKDLYFHVTHVSTKRGGELLSSQQRVTWDVTPKHLFFSTKESKGDLRFIMNPPIRDPVEVVSLQEIFYNGKVPMVASDHAPHLLSEKKKMVAGAPAVQEMYPLLIDRFLQDELDRSIMEKVIYTNPDKLLRKIGLDLPPQYITIDPNMSTRFTSKTIESKCRWSLWDGIELKGKITGLSNPESV